MKRLLIIWSFTFYALSTFGQNTWYIDNANSNVTFSVQWRKNSFRTGEFKIFSGEIVLQEGNTYKDAKVDFKLDATSISLITNSLSSLMQSPEYLNTKDFPEITYKSTSIKKKHGNNYQVTGILTIKGVSHEIPFMIEDNGLFEYEGREYGALKITGQINKSDFKIYGGGDLLGDLITITAYFETVKVAE